MVDEERANFTLLEAASSLASSLITAAADAVLLYGVFTPLPLDPLDAFEEVRAELQQGRV